MRNERGFVMAESSSVQSLDRAFDLLELELIWAGGRNRSNQMATHNQIPFLHDLFDIIIAGTSWA